MPPILRGFRVAVPVCVSAAVSFLSLRCCLFVGSHLIRNQLIAQIGIVRHCKTIANTSIRRRVATTRRRHKSRHHSHTTATARPRPGCDGRHGHDVRDVTPQPRPQRPWHDGHGAATATTDTAAIAYKGTCPRDTTRHAKTQSHKRSNVAPCNKHPRGGVPPPGSRSRGRWLSSADAECSLEHFWITRYLRSLHIFSGCNRFCTLHIVYNVPWIDVDGGRAQLGSASISGCYHSLRVA